jgi:selenocysteine lyase/cysteine desulfurase
VLGGIRQDVASVRQRDPAAHSKLEIVLCYPGLHAVWSYRLTHWMWTRHLKLAARAVSSLARTFTGVDIHPPAKFEAGTGNIADAVGLGAALDYVSRLGRPTIESYEHELLQYAMGEICSVPGLRLIGTAPQKASVLSFVLDGYSPEEVGSALDREGIAVRAGHHCAQPILRRYGLESVVRASLAMYNTHDEVDLLVAALRRLAVSSGNRR